MANFIERLLNGEKKTLHNLEKTAEQVMALANDMEALSDDALREKTQEYKHRYEEGETLDSLLVEAFATSREAARRTIGEYPYKVQIMGAVAMHQGDIAEMKTGEGKTLTSTMCVYLNALLRASGHPQKAMIATITTVIINTILDPIFIYLFHWGIQGAAIATILAQIIALVWQFKTFTNKNELLHLHRGIYKLRGTIVKNTIAIGMSPFLMNLAACFIVIFINKGLKEYDGDLAIGAFGIVNRIVFLFVMIVMGLNQGMQPIAGYNFGAQQYHRVNQVLKLTIYGATTVTTTGFLVGELMPELAVSAFTTHEGLIQLSATGLRIVVIFFPIIGFQMVTSNFFQSIGMAGKAIFLSLTRQLLFLLPCIILLPLFWGSAGIWWSMPISDLAASIVAGVMLYRQFKIFNTHGNKLKVEN